eukprot:2283318-Pyramimonas_sp.AAC.1
MEVEYSSPSLAALLEAMAKKWIPGISDERILNILRKMSLRYEFDDSIEDLLGAEWVTDCMDKAAAEEVLKEVQECRSLKANTEEFYADISKFRVAAFSLHGGGGGGVLGNRSGDDEGDEGERGG